MRKHIARFASSVAVLLALACATSAALARVQQAPFDPQPLMEALRKQKGKAADKGMKFLVFGDSKLNSAFERVLKYADSLKPDFVLTTSDLVGSGAGEKGKEEYAALRRQGEWFFKKYPFWPTVGNHELSGGPHGMENFKAFFGLDSKYSFTYGSAKFIALPWEHIADPKGVKDSATFQWLEGELKGGAGKHIFIIQHRPYYTVGNKSKSDVHGEPTPVTKLFTQYKVVASFSGHDHIYYRTLRDGVHYIISGGAGAGIYSLKRAKEALPQDVYYGGNAGGGKGQNLFHSPAKGDVPVNTNFYFVVAIEIQGGNVSMVMLDWDGKEWDRAVLKGDGAAPAK